MKIVFFGTPDFAIPVLESLHKEYNSGRERNLIAVVTQEPKPAGRDKFVTRSAVDNWAYKHKIPIVFDFDDIPEADLAVVAAYGKIIPENVIKKFSKGVLNIHPSLLPKYRGASPIQAAIAAGDDETGVTIIQMDEKMDHGPIISAFKEDILPTDTNEVLRNRLFERSSQFLIDLIPSYLSGKIKLKPQDHDSATFTKLVVKKDAFIESKELESAIKGDEKLSKKIDCLVRAMTPWPIAWTTVKIADETRRLKILKAHLENKKLVLDEVQLEGKNSVTWKQFTDGYPSLQL